MYNLPTPFLLQGTLYVRIKCIQMIRMMRFGDVPSAVSVQSVARWQRKNHK